MIRINLLPFRAARRKENVRRQVSIFVLSLILVLLVLSVGHFWLGAKQKSLTADVARVKKEIESYKEKNREIKELEKKLKDLEQRTAVIKDLEKNRFGPVHILDEMTTAVVEERMWLTRLDIRNNAVSINGIALDNQTVADYMDRLQAMPSLKDSEMPLFRKINLKRLELKTIRKTKMKSFQIVCDRAISKPKPAPNKKKRKK